MQRFKVLKTGIPELDERLGGGVPSNSIVLLSFQTGITFLEFTNWAVTKQMENPHVILVNLVSRAEEVIDRSNIKSAVDGENIKVREDPSFSVIDCFSQEGETTKRINGGDIYQIPYSYDIDKLYSTMRNVREKLSKDKWVIWVFDSLTDLGIGVSEEDMAKFCRRVFRLHKNCDDLAFYLLNIGAHNKSFIAMLTQMVDIAIDFKVEDKGDKLKKYLQVVKGNFSIDSRKLYYETKEKRKAIFY